MTSKPTTRLGGALLIGAAACGGLTTSHDQAPRDGGVEQPETGPGVDAPYANPPTKAAPGDVLWVNELGNEVPLALAPVTGGGVLWAGYAFAGESPGGTNVEAAGRLTSAGVSDWRDTSAGSDDDRSFVSVAALPDGSFVFGGANGNNAGTVHGTPIAADTGFLATRDATGTYGSVTPLQGTAIAGVTTNASGVVFVAGGSGGTPHDECSDAVGDSTDCPNALLAAFDASGNRSWLSTYTGNDPATASPAAWDDGGVSAFLYYRSNTTGPQGVQGPGITETGSGQVLGKWSADGTSVWSLDFPDETGVGISSTLARRDGTLLAAVGATAPFTIGTLTSTTKDALVILDAMGTPTSVTAWSAPIQLMAAIPSSDDVLLASITCGPDSCPGAMSLARVTSSGHAVWTTAFTVGEAGGTMDLTVGTDGVAYLAIWGTGTFQNADGRPFTTVAPPSTDASYKVGSGGSVVAVQL